MPAQGSNGYGTFKAECRKCGCGMSISRKDDPKAAAFREWTAEERLAVEETVRKGGPIYCPVDGTLIERRYDSLPGTFPRGPVTEVLCERCAQVYVRPRGTAAEQAAVDSSVDEGPAVRRKYISESAVNMLCSRPVLIQRHKMDDAKFLKIADEMPFHIYMICRRPRITFDPASITYGDKSISAQFIVHERTGPIYVPFTTGMDVEPEKRPIKCEYPYNEVRILDEKGDLIIGCHASYLLSQTAGDLHDYSQMKHLDLEVLYVGQAYGKEGERTAPNRLKNHETLLAIYAELAANAPEDEIWLAMLSFEPPITLMSLDGRQQHTAEVTGDADLAHLFNVLDTPVAERQRVCFAEAALIRHFQPKYNDKFKYNFPNPAHETYSQCYDLDLNAVAVELHFEELRLRLYSPTIPPQYNILVEFPLHSPELRQSIFDFAVKIPAKPAEPVKPKVADVKFEDVTQGDGKDLAKGEKVTK
ncbi:MAG: hypothetical protein K1X57_13590 [Gemmataceae bacterium]|nr:hypothetical protein [Gemmataceae bacterium]